MSKIQIAIRCGGVLLTVLAAVELNSARADDQVKPAQARAYGYVPSCGPACGPNCAPTCLSPFTPLSMPLPRICMPTFSPLSMPLPTICMTPFTPLSSPLPRISMTPLSMMCPPYPQFCPQMTLVNPPGYTPAPPLAPPPAPAPIVAPPPAPAPLPAPPPPVPYPIKK